MAETPGCNTPIEVAVTRLPHGRDLPLPDYATQQSAGLDLLAAIVGEQVLEPGARATLGAAGTSLAQARLQPA